MFRSDRFAALRGFAVLLAVALLFALLAAACDGDGDEGETPQAGDTPAAAETPPANGGDETPEVGETPEADGDEDVEAGGEAFEDIPLPDGADEVESVTISGSTLPFFVPAEAGVDAESFGELTMKEYEVDASPADVMEFYQDSRGDWDEAFSVATDEGGLLIWTKGDGDRAVWISAGEGSDAGTTALVILYGETG